MSSNKNISFHNKTLVVVVGPTAVGKTATAVFLAQHYATEIISADSRQFYREMSIGTAKPDQEEMADIKHHFINSHSIEEEYSAGDFERDALQILDQLFLENDKVILVGGSGLFVRAICEGLDDLPKGTDETRAKLNAEFAEAGLESMQRRLLEVDPSYYNASDISNPQRIIRALEVYETTGKPFSSYHQQKVAQRPFNTITVGLNMDRASLYERINLRVDKMMEKGLLDEVAHLTPYQEKPALLTVGYAELFAYLKGSISLERAVEMIKQNSRRYAKRQITWFKKYGETVWFTPDDRADMVTFIDSKVG